MRPIAPLRPALALALLLALASGCAKREANAPSAGGTAVAPVDGGTLVYARGHDSVRLDPAHETDGESFKVMDNVYENLVSFADTTTELVPELATRWDISPDGLTYTFHLRQGVKFHDGTPFNADAVVFSLDRQRDTKPAHPFHSVGGPYTYWQGMSMDDIVQGIKAQDDSTVVFTLKRRNAPFLANLAMGFTSIISPTAAKKYGEDFFKNPSGTGPFRFVDWTKDDSITLEKYPGVLGREGAPRSRRSSASSPRTRSACSRSRRARCRGSTGSTPSSPSGCRPTTSTTC
jgi:peptide/nickel transport system substrate-binding protein